MTRERGLIIRSGCDNAQGIGLGEARGLPGIVQESTGEQGERSRKGEEWRCWESEVMGMPPGTSDT